MVTFLTQIYPMHMRQDTGLSYFCRASLFCYSKYQDPPAEMDDFQLLPDNWGWEDTTPFKDEVHRCSILNSLEIYSELPQRGHHIQLMELPISSICWLSD